MKHETTNMNSKLLLFRPDTLEQGWKCQSSIYCIPNPSTFYLSVGQQTAYFDDKMEAIKYSITVVTFQIQII
jgi:hypothetical protein